MHPPAVFMTIESSHSMLSIVSRRRQNFREAEKKNAAQMERM